MSAWPRIAQRKRFEDLGVEFRKCPKNLAVLDFGTTHCSVGYLLDVPRRVQERKIEPDLLSLEASSPRISTCILFKPNGQRKAFGEEARDVFCNDLEADQKMRYSYFAHVKKEIQRDSVSTGYTIVLEESQADCLKIALLTRTRSRWLTKTNFCLSMQYP